MSSNIVQVNKSYIDQIYYKVSTFEWVALIDVIDVVAIMVS